MKLFFCSQPNHLKIFSKLIRDYKLKNTLAILLYTENNLSSIVAMKKELSESSFQSHIQLKLPIQPLRFNLLNIYILVKQYDQLLGSYQIDDVFLVSYERHYSLLCKLACDRGIRLNLVEEGTATYKFLVEGYKDNKYNNPSDIFDYVYLQLWKKIFTSDNNERSDRYYRIKVLDIIKASLLTLPVLFLHEVIQKAVLRIVPIYREESKAFLLNNFTFHTTYTSYPDLTNKVFSSNQSIKFIPYTLVDTDINFANINKGSYIFVSQPYKIDKDIFYPIILKILDGISTVEKNNIYIKLHPRESSESYDYLKKIIYNSSNPYIYLLEADSCISGEVLLSSGMFSKLIGITSTTLVYSHSINPDIHVISIVDQVLKKIPSKFSRVSNEILTHSKNIEIFKHINKI